MKFIGVRDLRNKSAQVFKDLNKEREIVITSNGKPKAILSAVTEGNLELTLALVRRAKAVRAVHELQMRSVEKGTDKIKIDQVNAEIRSSRKQRNS